MLYLLSMCAAECRSDNQNSKLLIWPHASFLNGSAAANSPGIYSFSVIDSLVAQAQSAFPKLTSVTMVGHSAGGQSLQVGGPCTMHLYKPLKPNASSYHLSGFLGNHREPPHHQLGAFLTSNTLALFFIVKEAALCLRCRPAVNMEQPETLLTVRACLQRYAGANRLTIPVNYIIANAGTYMYLSGQRVSTQALSALNTTCPQAQHSAACNLTGADFTQPWDGGGVLRRSWLAHVLHIPH